MINPFFIVEPLKQLNFFRSDSISNHTYPLGGFGSLEVDMRKRWKYMEVPSTCLSNSTIPLAIKDTNFLFAIYMSLVYPCLVAAEDIFPFFVYALMLYS